MKLLPATLLIISSMASPGEPEPPLAYFTNLREVKVIAKDRQNYVVVDADIWNHARPELSDLRLYATGSQVPYTLVEQRGGASGEEQPAKIFNLGEVNKHTEFDLDTGDLAEYDHIRLRLDAKNFVATATMEGRSMRDQGPGTTLGPSTLYDFSHENLGSNFVLKLPNSSFRYLHVRLARGIRPEQVKGATIYNLQEKKAAWTSVGNCRVGNEKERSTKIKCNLPATVPLDRVYLQVASGQVNFRRNVIVTDWQDRQLASGEISRIRVNRGGMWIVSENLTVYLQGAHSDRITIKVENGDDPALMFDTVQAQSFERRIYFEPQGQTSLQLYYGDEKLAAPVYDYAKFFKLDPAATLAQLGPQVHNPACSRRPDDRPWSERHKAILWLAMLLATLVLAVTALRGLRAGASTAS
jgi:hypothetical protein